MNRYDDIDPMNIDPATGRPYANYSSDALYTSFHDGEMDVDDEDEDEDEDEELDPDRLREDRDERAQQDEDENDDFWSDDPRAMQGMGL